MSTVLETVRHAVDDYEDEQNEENPTEPPEEIQDPEEHPTQNQASNEKNDYCSSRNDLCLDDLTRKLDLSQVSYQEITSEDPRQEYLRWHCKLGHLSHVQMQQLIANGTLLKSINMKIPPICVACVHGKATKRPWRTKVAIGASK
jgi:hypothetical protein